ncbi:ADP-ribose glycohydrolase OARD1 [Scaptodrosophila lebanonensis]|uniref:ADP-ribose glycohydrolase OARD1 n=1 Tax=Drosophila lebanonensis TaxID=7225 RepID=A0A6J2T911_DROLE|nr:ADP-ribose glycohydrolase OARD1 [Scaptodrosophila lebanonensis]
MTTFSLKEIEGDLFSASDAFSMCHCVAADMRMGKGIAVKFRNKFGQLAQLQKQNVQPGGVAILQHQQRYIYNLVTKQSSWGKPTYQLLHSSLSAMRQHMLAHRVTKLALPRIGCGLDGLAWPKVKDMLVDIFEADAVELVVYNYVPVAQK